MKKFFLKVKYFVKRNIYPITVTVCTALMIGIIAVSAYTSIAASNRVNSNNVIETNKPGADEVSDNNNPSGDEENKGDNDKPVTNPDPIIFDLPFENATISKEYADSSLLYDATTEMWCTHQGLDFACTDGQSVVAIFGGTISKIESSMMNGTTVYLKITDELVVVYKGLSSDVSVKEGDTVTKGQVIGKVTSMLLEKADGIHLHLELLKKDVLVDPTEYFSFSK